MSDSGMRVPQNSSKGNNHHGKNSTFSYPNQSGFMPNNTTSYRPTQGVSNINRNFGPGFMPNNTRSYRPTQGVSNSNRNFGPGFNQKQEEYTDASKALTRGPRANLFEGNSSKTPSGDRELGHNLKRDKFNLENFQCEYESAKFYVIKSYSEDDVHRSIKYKVWSSTPNGNEKLDRIFLDSEAETTRTRKGHPIFLFFSVNASGQFVGVAEMTGMVDFNKNLDIWQADTWLGFFPVKWHIIKDVPSQLFYRIILENNNGWPVTRSKDTQEVGLKQGIEMLQIFKKYVAKTSLLDDFNFYNNREKSMKSNRRRKIHSHSQTGAIRDERKVGKQIEADYTTSSLVKFTNNLAL